MGVRKPNTGELKSFVTFQRNAGKGSLGAGFLDGFVDLVTVRCKIDPMRGDRDSIMGNVGQAKQYKVKCRFHPEIDNNLPTLRAVIEGAVYTINNHDYIEESRRTFHVFEISTFT